MAAAAPGSHDAKAAAAATYRVRTRGADVCTAPGGLPAPPTAPRHGRREVPPPGAEPPASAPLLPVCAAEAPAPHRGRPRSGAPRWHPTSQNPAAVAGSDAKASRRRPRRLERTAVVDKSDALGAAPAGSGAESLECAFCVLGDDGFSLLRPGPSRRARPTLRPLSASPREAPAALVRDPALLLQQPLTGLASPGSLKRQHTALLKTLQSLTFLRGYGSFWREKS